MGEFSFYKKKREKVVERKFLKESSEDARNGSMTWVHLKIHCLIDTCSQRLKNKAEIGVDMGVDLLRI